MVLKINGDFKIVDFLHKFLPDTNANQTALNINSVYGPNATNDSTVRRWFEDRRSGNLDFRDDSHGRSTSKVNNDNLKAILEADTSKSTVELAKGFNA